MIQITHNLSVTRMSHVYDTCTAETKTRMASNHVCRRCKIHHTHVAKLNATHANASIHSNFEETIL